YGAVLAFLCSEIHVRQNALGVLEEMQIARTLEPVGNRSKYSQANTLRFSIAHEIERLVNELKVQTRLSRRLLHVLLCRLERFHVLHIRAGRLPVLTCV